MIGPLADTFAPGDVDGLLAAIERARARRARPPRRRPLRLRPPLGARVRRRARRPRGAVRAATACCTARPAPRHCAAVAPPGAAALRPPAAEPPCPTAARRATPRGRAPRRRARDLPALREIRDWLDDLGVDRVTLLVIPAPQLHPFPARSPELAYWLLDRRDAGDAIAQHGLQHRQHAARRRCSRARCGAGRAARPPSTRGSTRRPPRSRSRPAGACSTGAGLHAARVRRSRLRLHRRAARPPRRALRLVGDAAHAPRERRARARPRSVSARPHRSSAPPRRSWSAPARRSRGSCCGSTCTRPTSTTRATCRRRAGAGARARPHGGDLRRPLLKRRPARELARGRAPRRDAVRLHLPLAAALPAPVVLGLVLPRDRVVATSTPSAAAQELRTLMRAGRPDGFVPHTAFWQASPRWRRAPLYATASYRGDTGTESIQTPLLAVAWERVGGATATRPERSWRPTPAGSSANATPTSDGLLTILLPDESGLDDSPKYDAVYGRLAHWKPGYARLVQRCRRAHWSAAALARDDRRARRGRAGQHRARALPARAAPDDRQPRVGRARRAHRTGAARALLGRADAASSSTSPAAPSSQVKLSTWSSLAPLALAGIPREIRERLANEHLLHPRRYRARFGVPSVSMEEPSFRPGFNAYRTWRGAAWMNTELADGRRPARARRRRRGRHARRRARSTPSSAAASASTTTRARAPATASTGSGSRRWPSTSAGFRATAPG